MDIVKTNFLSDNLKEEYIKKMTEKLVVLRTMLHLSQSELANLIGIGRQMIVSFETKKRQMTWNTFLSLLFVFLQRQETKDLLEIFDIYTDELKKIYADGEF